MPWQTVDEVFKQINKMDEQRSYYKPLNSKDCKEEKELDKKCNYSNKEIAAKQQRMLQEYILKNRFDRPFTILYLIDKANWVMDYCDSGKRRKINQCLESLAKKYTVKRFKKGNSTYISITQ